MRKRITWKKISKLLFNRIIYVIIAVVAQVAWVVVQFLRMAAYSTYINIALALAGLLVVLLVIAGEQNPSYKLLWTFLILAVPILGLVLFLLVGETRLTSPLEKRYKKVSAESSMLRQAPMGTERKLERVDALAARQVRYLAQAAKAPLWENTKAEYFPMGDYMYPVLLRELKKAEHFIFMEYFIINYGILWNSILEILEEKVSQGVDVRIIYDDFGCMTTLPIRYYETLRRKGIQCEVFNRFHFLANIIHNNRDHRKICVIDGHTGFTGGMNLADEYINQTSRFGIWKDNGIMLKGEAVQSLTGMFLEMWNVVTCSKNPVEYSRFALASSPAQTWSGEGFIAPFSDSPLDREAVGENIYLSMLSQARKYVYICTPYLIVDNETMTALCLAAKSGVDVRIMTPGIPDKKLVFLSTRSYYAQLIRAGVKIYEYTPGFLHAKLCVSDHRVAVCGTINMDYRSFYLHFENGIWIYGNHVVRDMYRDFMGTLSSCRQVRLEDCREKNLFVQGTQTVLRLLSPLL